MRRKQLGMSPAKIAIAVAVTIEAIAGTGGMKKVTGTRSAVAIVAVRPGTAPTNRPNIAEPRITHSTYGSSTCASACERMEAVIALEGEALQDSPGQRDAQQLVERKVDDDRGDERDRQRQAPRRAEHPHPDGENRHRGEIEAERVGREHIEEKTGDDRDHAERRPPAAQPFGQRGEGRLDAQRL